MKVAVIAAAFFVATATHALAGKTPVIAPINFSACMNTSADYGQPTGMGAGNSGTKFSKLTFTLADPGAGNNFWLGGPGDQLIIRLSVKSPKTVYTIMNTWWGQPNIPNATVTFYFASGQRKKIRLIGNDNIRDYNSAEWTNTVNGTTTQEWWGSDDASTRLDVQSFNLGNKFAGDTLTKMVLSAPSNAAAGYFQPIIFAMGIDAGTNTVNSTCSTR